ncbi:MAG: leucine/isoleucine/valine transporter permease subunit [Firmicutes bacterium ADurb.Bin506]|jgi:branched-chain amino acid transport system permease protein|nr:MAG: leucine/isoleucine/valine transporter permease subunit [Firmicutes bacterium ADurb.Bin506]
MSFLEGVLILTGIVAIVAQGVYVLTGLTGLFSLGQASFMAVGAYSAGIANLRFGLGFIPSLCVGVVAALLASFVVGAPSLKLKKTYFSLATIAFGYGVESVLNVSTWTGGSIGLIGVANITRVWHVAIALGLVLWVVRNFKLSRYGRACVSVRTDETAAQVYGVNAFATKQMAFSLAAALAGLGGGLYAFYLGYLSPDMFGIPVSSEYLVMVFFGGLGSQTGAFAASVLLTALMEMLRTAAEWRVILYCLIILITLMFRPTGLFGSWELSFGRRRNGSAPPDSPGALAGGARK